MHCRFLTSCRRRSLRLALGANKKIKVLSLDGGITVGVMQFSTVKSTSVHQLKPKEGVEKSCRKRRKRGLRSGKGRSRVGKTRRSPPNLPPNPKTPSKPSAHYSRLYWWLVKSLNDLFRKKIDGRIDEFESVRFPRKGKQLQRSTIETYRKCKERYRVLQNTAKRSHLDSYPEIRLGKSFWDFIEKRRPSDMGDLLGALGVRPSTSSVATGFGRNQDGSFTFGRSKPVELPRDPSGLRRPDTSVVRKNIERKRAREINRVRSEALSGPTRPQCCSVGHTGMHLRNCPTLNSGSRRTRP